MLKKLNANIVFALSLIFTLVIGLFNGNINFQKQNFNNFNNNFDQQYLSKLKDFNYVLFSSPPSIRENYKNNILSTKKFLYIEIYDITRKKIKSVLKNLAQNDIEIKIIMENKKYKQYSDTFNILKNYLSGYKNVEIKSDQKLGTKYIHAKLIIKDNCFWIQTANRTYSSFYKNKEDRLYSCDPEISQNLQYLFQKDRNGEKITNQDIQTNILVCPINCRQKLETLLQSSKKNIQIRAQYISDPKIEKILKQKRDQGIEIIIHMPENIDNKFFAQQFGENYVKLYKKPYIHSKKIIIDNKLIMIGSMNLSSNSLDNNREIGIIVKSSTGI